MACEAWISVVCAPARWAMNRWASGGIIWSAVAIMYQLGVVFQAGTCDFSSNAAAVMGRCAAAATVAVRWGRPAANTCGKASRSMYSSTPGSPLTSGKVAGRRAGSQLAAGEAAGNVERAFAVVEGEGGDIYQADDVVGRRSGGGDDRAAIGVTHQYHGTIDPARDAG